MPPVTEAENQSSHLTALNSFLGAMQRFPEMTVSGLWICLPSFLQGEGGTSDADRKLLHHSRQSGVHYWAKVEGWDSRCGLGYLSWMS